LFIEITLTFINNYLLLLNIIENAILLSVYTGMTVVTFTATRYNYWTRNQCHSTQSWSVCKVTTRLENYSLRHYVRFKNSHHFRSPLMPSRMQKIEGLWNDWIFYYGLIITIRSELCLFFTYLLRDKTSIYIITTVFIRYV